MSSQRQIEANRRNAQKSTGPTSATGKAVSSMNALKTGIHAKSLLLPSEKLADLEQLIDEWYQRHNPTTPEARSLVATSSMVSGSSAAYAQPKLKSGPTTTRKTTGPTPGTPSVRPPPAVARPSPNSSGAWNVHAAPRARRFRTSNNFRPGLPLPGSPNQPPNRSPSRVSNRRQSPS